MVNDKVKEKFIGKDIKSKKERLPKQLWVPKILATHVQGPKLVESIGYLIVVAHNT